MLETIHIDDKDKHTRRHYYQQDAAVKQNNRLSNWQKIGHGIRQGWPVSLVHFNLNTEFILYELEESPGGITINSVITIRYVSNTTLLVDSDGLQKFLNLTNVAK